MKRPNTKTGYGPLERGGVDVMQDHVNQLVPRLVCKTVGGHVVPQAPSFLQFPHTGQVLLVVRVSKDIDATQQLHARQ